MDTYVAKHRFGRWKRCRVPFVSLYPYSGVSRSGARGGSGFCFLRLSVPLVNAVGYDPCEHKVLGITAMTKLLGKKKFEDLLSAFIEKPQGKPTLVPMSDKRPAMNKSAEAANDFKEEN